MYQFPHFTEDNQDAIVEFIQQHPFATLVGFYNGQSEATQVPLMVEKRGDKLYLKGHVFKHSSHYPALVNNKDILVLFTGANCYVSASWYTKRGEGSTWNYLTVQARGNVTWYNDDETLALLTELTHQYDDVQEQPELVEGMTKEYLSANIKAIAGFEIEVTQLDATFKLSQNKDDETYKNIVGKLLESNDINSICIAGEMMQLRPELFA